MNDGQQADAADVLARVGRDWGWIFAFGVITLLAGVAVLAWPGRTLFYGVMEITLAFRIRSLGHQAAIHAAHAV
jgi:hypothetical protein